MEISYFYLFFGVFSVDFLFHMYFLVKSCIVWSAHPFTAALSSLTSKLFHYLSMGKYDRLYSKAIRANSKIRVDVVVGDSDFLTVAS
jgi:hypothetical protein